MITKTIQIDNISVDELAVKIADKLLSKIEVYLNNYVNKKKHFINTWRNCKLS